MLGFGESAVRVIPYWQIEQWIVILAIVILLILIVIRLGKIFAVLTATDSDQRAEREHRKISDAEIDRALFDGLGQLSNDDMNRVKAWGRTEFLAYRERVREDTEEARKQRDADLAKRVESDGYFDGPPETPEEHDIYRIYGKSALREYRARKKLSNGS